MTTATRGRKKEQSHMEEKQLDNSDVLPLLNKIDFLQGELEEDEETKQQRKDLRQTVKDLRNLVKALELPDGRYRVAQSGWVLEVTNNPGGTKEVTYGPSVAVKIESVE